MKATLFFLATLAAAVSAQSFLKTIVRNANAEEDCPCSALGSWCQYAPAHEPCPRANLCHGTNVTCDCDTCPTSGKSCTGCDGPSPGPTPGPSPTPPAPAACGNGTGPAFYECLCDVGSVFKAPTPDDKLFLHQDPPDVAQSKGSGVCGDPCLNSKTCKKELNCDPTQNHCISGMSNTTTGDDCNAAKNSTVGFAPCSCNVVHAAECAGAVATCAVACIGSFGAACLACIDLIPGCCDCASHLFHFDCSHC